MFGVGPAVRERGWRRPGWTLTLLVLLGSLLPRPSELQAAEFFWKWKPIPPTAWAEPDSLDGQRPHAVVLWNAVIMDHRKAARGEAWFSQYRRVRVFDEEGISWAGKVEVTYPKGARIRNLKARTVKPNGDVIEVPSSEFHEKVVLDTGFAELRAKAFAFRGVEAGDIVEYFVTIRWPFHFVPTLPLQEEVPVEEAQVDWYFWQLPPGYWVAREDIPAPSWIVTGATGLDVKVEELPSPREVERIRVVARDLPAFPDENYGPPASAVGCRFFGQYVWPEKDKEEPYWERTARELGEATSEYLKKGRKEVRKLLGDLPAQERNLFRDLAECLQRIHEAVRSYDYLSEEEREEVKRPKNKHVKDLLKKGLGRSDELGVLAVEMMRQLGYDATLFYAVDRSRGAFIRQWQTMYQFDRTGVLVSDGEKFLWAYPQIPGSAPGSLPWQIQGCVAFLERMPDRNPTPETFKVIPLDPPARNTVQLEYDLVPEGRDLTGTLRAEFACPAELVWIHALSNEDMTAACEEVRGRILPEGVLVESREESLTVRPGHGLSYACRVRIEGILEEAGDQILWFPGRLRPETLRFGRGKRRTQIHFKYPCVEVVRVQIELPEGVELDTAPDPVELRGLRMSYASSFQPGSMVWTRTLVLEEVLFRAPAADTLRSFFDRVHQADETPVVFSRAASRPTASG
jgi:hypothetical protein